MSALPKSRRRTGFGLAWVSSAEYIGQPCNTSIRLDRVDFDRLNPSAPFGRQALRCTPSQIDPNE